MTRFETRPRVVAIVQARVESTRFPKKVIAEIGGRPLLQYQLERLMPCESVDQVVLAIPESKPNDCLVSIGESCGVSVFRGDAEDLLHRFHNAALESEADVVVRLTADCPLSDPTVIDSVVRYYLETDFQFCATGLSFPDGFDVEVFSSELLALAHAEAVSSYEREHVTPFMKSYCSESVHYLEWREDLSHIRLTVDEPEDLMVVESVIRALEGKNPGIDAISDLAKRQPELFTQNQVYGRNEGSTMGTGQKLWRRAKRVIPGGGMLFSKRAEQFSPTMWPAYFSRTEGCRVWDLDGREFLDVGYMGVGTNILGYNHPKVQSAVMRVVQQGNLSTLNAPEEVHLAEELVSIHPWSEMVKFARSGGEACAIAIRIARAASGKDGIAFCGYHGWHDWYISANLGSADSLRGHLLPGLKTSGVPASLENTSFAFEYGNLADLRALLVSRNIGVIFMEVQRNIVPVEGYLSKVRELADEFGALLVFDENTSGFREVLGGLHLARGVNPDLAVFGKTLGNGYAINAILGTRRVMEFAENSFVSSTFWTERIGPTAGLAALEAMKDEEAPSRVKAIGLEVRKAWESIGKDLGLEIDVFGLPALSTFALKGFDPLMTKTFIVEKMLELGFLAPPAFYASIAHTDEVLDRYFHALLNVLREIASIGPDNLRDNLQTEAASDGLPRMN